MIAFVQSKAAGISAGENKRVVLDDPPTEANVLVAILANDGSNVATPPAGQGWTEVGAAHIEGTGDHRVMMWWRPVGAGESATVGDWSINANIALMVAEASGVEALDIADTASEQAATLEPTLPALAASGNVLIVAGLAVGIADWESAAHTPDAGYTELMDSKVGSGIGGGPAGVAIYRIATGAGPWTAGVTASLSRDWGGVVAAFEAAVLPSGVYIDWDND
jgi:hypothetical protein